jgi:hypothetical protein
MRISRFTVVALLASAAFAGPAAAMPTDPPHGPGQPPVVVQAAPPAAETSSSFDWGSAIIGAAGGVGAFAIALAATGGMRRRRLPSPGHAVPALMAVALVAPASLPARDDLTPVACHRMLPARVDAAAHAEIMRAIGAAQMERDSG